MITYHFHISNNLTAKAIRLYSKYSHVSIEFMGYVYEAVMLDEKTGRRGVIKTPVEFYDMSDVVKSESIEVLYPEVVHKWLESQLGKDYDYFGVLSFVWRFLPHNMGAFYCSELAMVSLMKGLGIDSSEYSQKKTPQEFYELVNILQWIK